MSLSKTQFFLFFESGNYVKATRRLPQASSLSCLHRFIIIFIDGVICIIVELHAIDIPAFGIYRSDFFKTIPVVFINAELILCPAGIDTGQVPRIQGGGCLVTRGIFALPVFGAQVSKLDAQFAVIDTASQVKNRCSL